MPSLRTGRKAGDYVPEVVHFLAKLPVFTDQPRDHRVELVLLVCGLAQPVGLHCMFWNQRMSSEGRSEGNGSLLRSAGSRT